MKKKNKILLTSLLLPTALTVAIVSVSCAKSTENNNSAPDNPNQSIPQPIDISNCIVSNTSKVFDNQEFDLKTIEVKYNNIDLIIDVDYKINSNKPLVDVGNYEVEIIGINKYTGTKLVQISITEQNKPKPIDISNCTVKNTTKVFDNKIFSLNSIEVFDGAKKLVSHTDYTIQKNNQNNIVDVGVYNINIIGKNNYTGNKQVEISITKATNAIIEFKIVSNKPTAKAKFGKPYFKYSNDQSFSNPTVNIPSQPGTYYTKAFVDATNNYDAVESDNILSFTIKTPAPTENKDIEFKPESTYKYGDPNLIVADSNFDFSDWFKSKIIEHRNDIFNFSNQTFYNEQYFIDNLTIQNYQQDSKAQTIYGTVELLKPESQKINKTITFNGFKDINVFMTEQINHFNNNINSIQLLKTTFTQDEINNLNNDNFLDLVLQTLPFDDNFTTPSIVNLSKDNNQFSFQVKLSLTQDESYNQTSHNINLAYQINNPTPPPSDTGVTAAVNYLNSINLQIDPNKMTSNGFIWLNNSIFDNDNGIYSKLKDFNLNDFEKKYSVRVRSGNKFELDAINYRLTFNMIIYKDSDEKTTKDFVIDYVPLDKYIGTIDTLPTDSVVAVTNSMKNKLEITNILNDNRYLSNNIKSLNSNITIKIREYMYQIRFLFYQMFSDNATAIDYGIQSNNNNQLSLLLKAKIKDSISFRPYLQVNNEELNNTNFNVGDIICIQYDILNLNEAIQKLESADSILPGLDGGMSLAQGNKQQVSAGLRKDLSLIKMASVNINISKNNQSIYNKSNIINRFFLFSFLSKIK